MCFCLGWMLESIVLAGPAKHTSTQKICLIISMEFRYLETLSVVVPPKRRIQQQHKHSKHTHSRRTLKYLTCIAAMAAKQTIGTTICSKCLVWCWPAASPVAVAESPMATAAAAILKPPAREFNYLRTAARS